MLVAGRPTPRKMPGISSVMYLPRAGGVSALSGGTFHQEIPCEHIKHIFTHANKKVWAFGSEDCFGILDGSSRIRTYELSARRHLRAHLQSDGWYLLSVDHNVQRNSFPLQQEHSNTGTLNSFTTRHTRVYISRSIIISQSNQIQARVQHQYMLVVVEILDNSIVNFIQP